MAADEADEQYWTDQTKQVTASSEQTVIAFDPLHPLHPLPNTSHTQFSIGQQNFASDKADRSDKTDQTSIDCKSA
ncbi:MAG: hypothetical protein ACK4S4_12765 [Pyrinomonadaceae bacterium]